MKDPVAEATFKQYKEWKKVNTAPVLSATHGNRYVFTYLNKTAAPAGLQGKFPFPRGAVLAKESFEGQDGKPGPKGPLFIMEKRGEAAWILLPLGNDGLAPAASAEKATTSYGLNFPAFTAAGSARFNVPLSFPIVPDL